MKSDLKEGLEKLKEIYTPTIKSTTLFLFNFVLSLLVLYLIRNINTLGHTLVEAIFSSKFTALIFGSVMIAPIVEEYGKRFCMKRGFLMMFALVFGFGELLFYMMDGVAFADRIAVVFVHITLAFVQQRFHDESIRLDNPWISKFGFLGAILIHAFYNLSVISTIT